MAVSQAAKEHLAKLAVQGVKAEPKAKAKKAPTKKKAAPKKGE